MKKLTKILMLFIVTLFFYQVNAQTFTVKGGLNLAKMLQKDTDHIYSTEHSMKPGFHLGFTAEMPIHEYISIEPGIIFTNKGTLYKDKENGYDIKAKLNLYYLEVPLTLKTTHDIGNGLKVYGAVGPYLSLGLSGKYKYSEKYQGETATEESTVEWGNKKGEDFLRRLDMGATLGAGVEMNSMLLGLSFDLGLTNIATNQDYGTTIKNRVLKLSVGYRF